MVCVANSFSDDFYFLNSYLIRLQSWFHEEALLDMKKQRLLMSMQTLNSHGTSEEISGEGKEGGEGEKCGEGGREDGRESMDKEEDEKLQGVRCQAPLEEVRKCSS